MTGAPIMRTATLAVALLAATTFAAPALAAPAAPLPAIIHCDPQEGGVHTPPPGLEACTAQPPGVAYAPQGRFRETSPTHAVDRWLLDVALKARAPDDAPCGIVKVLFERGGSTGGAPACRDGVPGAPERPRQAATGTTAATEAAMAAREAGSEPSPSPPPTGAIAGRGAETTEGATSPVLSYLIPASASQRLEVRLPDGFKRCPAGDAGQPDDGQDRAVVQAEVPEALPASLPVRVSRDCADRTKDAGLRLAGRRLELAPAAEGRTFARLDPADPRSLSVTLGAVQLGGAAPGYAPRLWGLVAPTGAPECRPGRCTFRYRLPAPAAVEALDLLVALAPEEERGRLLDPATGKPVPEGERWVKVDRWQFPAGDRLAVVVTKDVLTAMAQRGDERDAIPLEDPISRALKVGKDVTCVEPEPGKPRRRVGSITAPRADDPEQRPRVLLDVLRPRCDLVALPLRDQVKILRGDDAVTEVLLRVATDECAFELTQLTEAVGGTADATVLFAYRQTRSPRCEPPSWTGDPGTATPLGRITVSREVGSGSLQGVVALQLERIPESAQPAQYPLPLVDKYGDKVEWAAARDGVLRALPTPDLARPLVFARFGAPPGAASAVPDDQDITALQALAAGRDNLLQFDLREPEQWTLAVEPSTSFEACPGEPSPIMASAGTHRFCVRATRPGATPLGFTATREAPFAAVRLPGAAAPPGVDLSRRSVQVGSRRQVTALSARPHPLWLNLGDAELRCFGARRVAAPDDGPPPAGPPPEPPPTVAPARSGPGVASPTRATGACAFDADGDHVGAGPRARRPAAAVRISSGGPARAIDYDAVEGCFVRIPLWDASPAPSEESQRRFLRRHGPQRIALGLEIEKEAERNAFEKDGAAFPGEVVLGHGPDDQIASPNFCTVPGKGAQAGTTAGWLEVPFDLTQGGRVTLAEYRRARVKVTHVAPELGDKMQQRSAYAGDATISFPASAYEGLVRRMPRFVAKRWDADGLFEGYGLRAYLTTTVPGVTRYPNSGRAASTSTAYRGLETPSLKWGLLAVAELWDFDQDKEALPFGNLQVNAGVLVFNLPLGKNVGIYQTSAVAGLAFKLIKSADLNLVLWHEWSLDSYADRGRYSGWLFGFNVNVGSVGK